MAAVLFLKSSSQYVVCTLAFLFDKVQIHCAAIDLIHFCGSFYKYAGGGAACYQLFQTLGQWWRRSRLHQACLGIKSEDASYDYNI